jgi:putative transposase
MGNTRWPWLESRSLRRSRCHGGRLHLWTNVHAPRQTLAAQQRAFDRFRRLYNTERPHQALGGATPASRYRPSPRPYPDPLPPIEYPGHFTVREITAAGTFRFKDRLLFLSNALRHYPVGLEEVADGIWSVYFCHVLLARIDERTGTLNRG